MIVRCKSNWNKLINSKQDGLTLEKCYTVTEEDRFGWRVIDDLGRNFWYIKENFYSIEEERDMKINKLIED